MLFNVSGLIQDGIGATRRYQVEDTLVKTDGKPEQVSGGLELLNIKDGVLVRAKLELVTDELCSRCLRPLDETLHLSFEEEFLTTVDLQSGQPVDELPDPEAFRIDENHILDLTEAIRQYREVSIEMQPLCRPDCRGLCPICGADLNAGNCGCNAGAIDARWAGLAELLEENDGTEAQSEHPAASTKTAKSGRVRRGRSASNSNRRRTA